MLVLKVKARSLILRFILTLVLSLNLEFTVDVYGNVLRIIFKINVQNKF
jgi:hypothetical protein